MDVVFQADLVAGVGGDSLRTPALDADEVGFREISSHGEQANLAGSLGGLKIALVWPGHRSPTHGMKCRLRDGLRHSLGSSLVDVCPGWGLSVLREI
jgi:hypothetical protein